MKTITILSQKGGSGKSTLATALAVYADTHRKLALLVDLDPQGSSVKWFERREAESPATVSAQGVALPRILEAARADGVDLVFVDTAPHSESAAMQAAKVCDLILIPCRGSIHDIEAVENTVTVAQLSGKRAVVVLNAIPPNAPRMVEDVREAIESTYSVPVLSSWLCHRSDFVHSATEGKTPVDYAPQGKAAGEVAAVYKSIIKLVNK